MLSKTNILIKTESPAGAGKLAGEGILILHAMFGELAFITFGWALVELMEPTKTRIIRAKWATLAGFVGTVLSWIVGGYYYLTIYPKARNLIRGGPWPWGHLIVMETKEHLFLIGPFLAALLLFIVWWKGEKLMVDNDSRRAALTLSAVLAVGAIVMLFTGAIIGISERVALG